MAIDIDEARSVIAGLIQSIKDSEAGYRIAAGKAKDPELARLFLEFSGERAQYAGRLRAEASALAGEPPASAGAIHEAWAGLNSAAVVDNDLTVLEQVERGDDATLKNYHEALTRDLPSGLRAVVERQYWDIRKVHDRIRFLSDSHWKKEVPMAGLV